MRTVSLEQCPLLPRDDGFEMRSLFGPDTKPHQAVHMGYAVFKPGMRVPAEGLTTHEGDEFSYILSGKLNCCSKSGQTQQICANDAIYISAGEEHYSYNDGDEDCALVYMMVKTI